MENKKDDCHFYRSFINAQYEFKMNCVKHYCRCTDEFMYDDNLNKRYQEAKKNNQAEAGIFKRNEDRFF